MESQDGFVQETAGNVPELVNLIQRLDEFIILVDQLDLKLKDVKHFYFRANTKHPNTPEAGSMAGDEYREKLVESSKKRKSIAAHMEIANAKRMQELVHEFGTIIHEITQQKYAEPFIHPVDVIGLGLHDYYEVVEKPMDFSIIKIKMEAKVDAGYKNVREICADVRLIFDNAMKYYKETDDLYVMAKTLLDMFERRWLEFLPKVDEEEQRQKEEDGQTQGIYLTEEAAAKMVRDRALEEQRQKEEDGQMQGIYLTEKAAAKMVRDRALEEQRQKEEDEQMQGIDLTEEAAAKMVRDLALEIDELDLKFNKISDLVYQKYLRKMTIDDKKKLGEAIGKLSHEGLNRVIEFIAANDSNFERTGKSVEIDLDAQSNPTLWRLKFFVEDELKGQTSPPCSGENDDEGNNLNNSDKGEQETCDDFTKN